MATPRQRMVPPGLAVDLGLTPLLKRVVYIGLMQIAEDSGCFNWSARDVRSAALPLEPNVSDDDVEHVMGELEADGYVWSYQAEGMGCGYIANFPEHQRSLTRYNTPQSVPLPPGLICEEIPTSHRYGTCRYTFPKSRAAMLGTLPPTQPSNHPLSQPITHRADDSLSTACALCGGSGLALDGSPCVRCRS